MSKRERGGTRIDVQKDLVREPARDESLTELALGVDLGVEEIGIARAVRVVSVHGRLVLFARRPRAWNDRGTEGGRPSTLVVHVSIFTGPGKPAARERELVQRVNPVGRVVELPVGVNVGLLHRVVRAETQLNRNDVRLPIREMIRVTNNE